MARLLSIVLLASLLGGFSAPGTPALHAENTQEVVLSHGGSHSGGPMHAMDCGACASPGACIVSRPTQSVGAHVTGLSPLQPSIEPSGQTCAPDTAPPKPSSI